MFNSTPRNETARPKDKMDRGQWWILVTFALIVFSVMLGSPAAWSEDRRDDDDDDLGRHACSVKKGQKVNNHRLKGGGIA